MRKPLVLATAAAASLVLAVPGQATAAKKTIDIRVLTTQVGAPFNVDVSRHGLFVADGGPGTVSRVHHDGSLTTVVAGVPGASGVAVNRWGKLAYTSTVTDEATFENTASALYIKGRHHTVKADTLAYEQRRNPDKVITYGIKHPSQCQRDVLGDQVKYKGLVDSHAYSVAAWGHKWLVADAGGNDLLSVDRWGHIRTVAVLPAQPLKITAAAAASLGVPDCFIGATYKFEAVPTDVEVGHDGYLYVSTLPGGPEDPSLGARGSVYRVNPWNHHVKLVATGFAGATNLAIQHGKIYVAELFAGQISVIRHGRAHPYVTLPGAVAVESGRGCDLVAATIDLENGGPGSIVKITARHKHYYKIS